MKKYIKAIGIWFLIIPLAIINGGFREYVLAPLGAIALPLSGLMLSVCILLMAVLFIPKVKTNSKIDYYIMGIIWFVLTNLFDLAMYISEGGGVAELVESYYFLEGNMWVVVVLTALFAPPIAVKIHHIMK